MGRGPSPDLLRRGRPRRQSSARPQGDRAWAAGGADWARGRFCAGRTEAFAQSEIRHRHIAWAAHHARRYCGGCRLGARAGRARRLALT